MASDVEMEDVKIQVTNTPASKIAIPVLVHSPSPPQTAQPQPTPPPPTAETTAVAKPASATQPAAKPKSTKTPKAHSPSPSPPPPPPVVPLRTVRLEIHLGGPSNYEVDIAKRSKETGQRELTPPAPPKKVADSSDEEEDDDDKKDKPKRKKRKNAASEYYDTSDPFIDDSELALDERQYFAQTKQQGFYVSSGEVALMKDKTPKKPKSKRPTLLSGLGITTTKKEPTTVRKTSTPGPDGTREAPISIDQDDSLPGAAGPSNQPNPTSTILKPSLTYAPGADPALVQSGLVGQKRKRSAIVTVTGENGKKKKIVDETAFHPDLQKAITELKALIANESWEQKGKFPTQLKPQLAKLALLAIRLDEYDDDFFSLMPQLFPYNKFTMTKLIKRTVFSEHMGLLTERQDELLKQLKDLASAGFAKAEEEWEKSVVAWDKRQEKIRHEAAEASATGTNSAAPTRHPTEEMDVDGEEGSGTKDRDKDKEKDKEKEPGHTPAQTQANPPAKRYRLTEAMKAVIWELVVLSNECCRLENEKNGLEGSVIQVSDQGLRKVLYQKIVAAFPEGWMSSGHISRDVSAMKKKLEKEAMEQGDDD